MYWRSDGLDMWKFKGFVYAADQFNYEVLTRRSRRAGIQTG